MAVDQAAGDPDRCAISSIGRLEHAALVEQRARRGDELALADLTLWWLPVASDRSQVERVLNRLERY